MRAWNKKRKPKHHTKLYWVCLGEWAGIVKDMKDPKRKEEGYFIWLTINRTSNVAYKSLKIDRRRNRK